MKRTHSRWNSAVFGPIPSNSTHAPARATLSCKLWSRSFWAWTQTNFSGLTLSAVTISSCSTAAAPSPVCEAIVNPVSREVNAAARTSFPSISSSGPRLTPVLMNRGRQASRVSAIHRLASCRDDSLRANAGTNLWSAAPYKPVFDQISTPAASDSRASRSGSAPESSACTPASAGTPTFSRLRA